MTCLRHHPSFPSLLWGVYRYIVQEKEEKKNGEMEGVADLHLKDVGQEFRSSFNSWVAV